LLARHSLLTLLMAKRQGPLPTQPLSSAEPAFDEKVTVAYIDTPSDDKDATPDSIKSSHDHEDTNERPLYVGGEPVITSGRDVSKHLVDLRDDGDPPFTFRSIVLGTVIGALGAALYQVCFSVSGDLDVGLRTLLVDLHLQTYSRSDLNSISTDRYLLVWRFLGKLCAKAFSGRRNAIRMAWPCSPFHQPRQIQAQGGTPLLFIPTGISLKFS
jgi:hypothetical protein